ncbi:hypothetical protein Dimus_022384 [Dionaea muscipula]
MWFILQCKVDLGDLFQRIPLEKAQFEPQVSKILAKVEINSSAKDAIDSVKSWANVNDIATTTKNVDHPLVEKVSKKDTDVSKQKKAKGGKAAVEEKRSYRKKRQP